MKLVYGDPPIYAECVKRFGPLRPHVMFAWGDTIFTRQVRQEVDLGLIRHEYVHSQQQKRHGGPAAWWARYLTDPDFRREQEIEAYRAQLAFYALKLPRKVLRQAEIAISKELCGPMYGRMMTRQDAMQVLKDKSWRPGPAALPALPPVVKLQVPDEWDQEAAANREKAAQYSRGLVTALAPGLRASWLRRLWQRVAS